MDPRIEFIVKTASAEPAEIEAVVLDMLGHKAGVVDSPGTLGASASKMAKQFGEAMQSDTAHNVAAATLPLLGGAVGAGMAGKGKRAKGALIGGAAGAIAGAGASTKGIEILKGVLARLGGAPSGNLPEIAEVPGERYTGRNATDLVNQTMAPGGAASAERVTAVPTKK